MKERESEVERKVIQVFSSEKNIMETNITSSNLSSQPNPESTQIPLTEASTSYKSRVSQKLNFTTQSSNGATNPSSITTTTNSPIEMFPIETERSCYIVQDSSVLDEILNKVSSCPECNEREISTMNNLEKK